jgi:DNA primase
MNTMQGEAKEEIRAKLDIEAVVGEYVQLKRAGRNWKGLSPFSSEKTPSFFVSPEKGIWHDFSSNQGGDVFSFVMMVEGLDFRGALEHLARKAGVELSDYEQKGSSSRGNAEKKKRLLSMHESAATYYQRSLFSTPEAVEYVKNRGLNRQVVHDFRLGYAPSDGRSLLNFLTKKGYTTAELRDGGLIGSRGSDIFRDRLMVPLMDGQGQVIGFTARLIRDVEGAPKYLNTPQTLLYDKSRHVFGLHLAKESIRKQDRAVIVEGNLDVISSHQAEVYNVVATAGTALTEYHLKALSRLTHNVCVAFDGDRAGIAATERAIPIAQVVEVELNIVVLPDTAKDPDELIQQDASLWHRAIEAAQPAIDWVITQYESRNDLTTTLGIRNLTTEALLLLGQLDNSVVKERYLKQLSEKTGTSYDTLVTRMEQLIAEMAPGRPLKPIKHSLAEEVTVQNPKQDHLLALLCFENGVRDVAMELSVDAFEGDARQALFRYLVTHPGGLSLDQVPPELQEFEVYVKIVQLKAETRYSERTAQERNNEASHLVGQIKKQHLKQKKLALTNLLRDAEAGGNEPEVMRLRSELNDLIKEGYSRGKDRNT